MLWRKPTRSENPLPDSSVIRIVEVSIAVMNISNFWKTIISAAAWAEKHSVWIMPAQRPSFIPWKLSGFTESLCSPNTSRRSQSSNTLPCSTTAKGFIRHSAICPRVSSKPITIFQGSTCPPKLDQISSLLALMNRKSMNTSLELFWKSHFKRKCMSIICTMSHWSWFS